MKTQNLLKSIVFALPLLITSCDSDNTDSRDGKKYGTVKIGDQIWMSENLNYAAEGSKCYGNEPANCQKFGRLYTWMLAQTACPKGWHLPSNDEWQILVNFTGGRNLKASRGWSGAGNGKDTYGFSGLPGGYGISDGYFLNTGYIGYWWTSSEDNSDYAFSRDMVYDDETVYYNDNDKSNLYSVRCIKN
ncbi:MAG: fibrobacter succinogenes major paralogous domain-containing protein [Fibromonadaceae bacterium]|jgi:uncharacterized protein (TIGR02145 family)|nr:fibrobacter succinogenes major paralogous domain-containing protein [Fibromonadaceae bacterium]